MKGKTLLILLLLFIGATGCERIDLFKKSAPGDSATAKAITSFTFMGGGVIGVIDEDSYTVSATLPFGTDVTTLAPEFITTGASVWVGAMEQESGVTTNNFTSSVTYTVHASDGSTRDYVTTVTVPTGTPWSLLNDAGTGGIFFGGDANHATGRNVACGQSINFPQNVYVTDFSFYLSSGFIQNVLVTPVDAPVRLNVRNDSGAILHTFEIVVSDAFPGGWMTWTGLNIDVSAGTTLIFTTHVIEGTYVNEYSSGLDVDFSGNPFAGGERYVNGDDLTDDEIEAWPGNWDSFATGDMNFRVDGYSY